MKKLPDKCIDLAIIDPPYNIKKAKWDDIKDYENLFIKWLLGIQRVLKDNGSFYFFHSEMSIIAKLMKRIESETNFIYRQFIVWNKRFYGAKSKGFLDGYVEIDGLRNYQQMAEYILFYTFQDETGLSKIMGNCVYSVRDYIRKEIIKAKGKIILKDINSVLGTAINGGGVASACLSEDKTVPAMITEEHYLKIREWLNCGTEYEYLRTEYEDLRFTFNNQKIHHSVWDFNIENEKEFHITTKPVPIIQNIILHSSKPGDLVLDCFSGSGTTAIACHKEKRRFICVEKDLQYCELSRERLEKEQQQLNLFK